MLFHAGKQEQEIAKVNPAPLVVVYLITVPRITDENLAPKRDYYDIWIPSNKFDAKTITRTVTAFRTFVFKTIALKKYCAST